MKRIHMNTISISDIQRNLHKLEHFDIVEVVDKKRHKVKGYFLDKKYHDFVEELFEKKKNKTNKDVEAFRKLRKNVSKIDPSIDILKMEDEINNDLF